MEENDSNSKLVLEQDQPSEEKNEEEKVEELEEEDKAEEPALVCEMIEEWKPPPPYNTVFDEDREKV